MDADTRAGVVAGLLQRSQMPRSEAARRVALAADPDQWRGLSPGLEIGGTEAAPLAIDVADTDLRDALDLLDRDGYFRLPPVVAASTLAAVNGAIDAIVTAGWPPVFAWVYDELWRFARLPAVSAVLTAALGADYAQIPHVWVHVVPAAVGASGWTPHFDGSGTRRASVWLALTDATLDNGCMHLVPRRLLPDAFRQTRVEAVAVRDVLRVLQATRALPAPAGAALGWLFDVMHWGGPCVRPAQPRRAISMEFLAASERPDGDESPLVPVTGALPTLDARLRMIGRAMQTYEKFEPGLVRYRALADVLATGGR
jgi:hypothetical protein